MSLFGAAVCDRSSDKLGIIYLLIRVLDFRVYQFEKFPEHQTMAGILL